MKSQICLAILTVIVLLLTTIKLSKSECCSVPIKCSNTSSTTYRCYDCTEATAYCGVGKCNILGCNCDGGCRQGDSTLWCWNIATSCSLRSFFYEPVVNGNGNSVTTIDVNNDGVVSFDEAKQFIVQYSNQIEGERVNEQLAKLDTNGDGVLSFNEIDSY